MALPSSLISYMVAERQVSGAPNSRSEARAEAIGRRLQTLVGRRCWHGAALGCPPRRPPPPTAPRTPPPRRGSPPPRRPRPSPSVPGGTGHRRGVLGLPPPAYHP